MFRWRHFFRASFRALRTGVWVYLEVFVALMLLLATAPVQNLFRPWLLSQASAALGVEVQSSYINLGLPDHIVLHDVVMCDRADIEMIRVGRLGISLISFSTLDFLTGAATRSIRVRAVSLEDAYLNLYHRTKDDRLNLDVVFEGEAPPPPDPAKDSGKRTLVAVGNVSIRNMKFRFVDSLKTRPELVPTAGHVNYSNLNLQIVNLSGGFDVLGPGHFRVQVNHMSFREVHSGLLIDDLATTFDAEQHWPQHENLPSADDDSVSYIRIGDTHIRSGNTDIRFDVTFRNELFKTLYRDNVPKAYRFEVLPSKVDFATVNYFVSEDVPVVGVAQLQGLITGNRTRLKCNNLRLDYGQQTHIEADVRLEDYLKSDSIFIQARLKGACTEGNELHRLLPTSGLPAELRNLGSVCATGNYIGFIRDFVADARFETSLGVIVSDLNFKRIRGLPVQYEGRLVTEKFNLDALLGTKVSRSLSFDGSLVGRGIQFAEANTQLDFTLRSSELLGYTIDSISSSLKLADKRIVGSLGVRDPEGSFVGDVDLDLGLPVPKYTLLGKLSALNLNHYGLLPDTITLSTDFALKLEGDSLDSFTGEVSSGDLALRNVPRNERFDLTKLHLTSSRKTSTSKRVELSSSLGSVGLEGEFSYAEAYSLIRRLAHESQLFLRNQPDSIGYYYMNKYPPTKATSFEATVQIADLNPLLRFVRSPLRIAAGSKLHTAASFDMFENAKIDFTADTLAWGSIRLHGIKANLEVDKPSLENLLVGEGNITVGRLFPSEGVMIERVLLRPKIQNRQIDVLVSGVQDSLNKQLLLKASIGLTPDGFVAGVDPDSSRLTLYGTNWRFDPDNRIEYGPGRLLIEDLRISSGTQSVAVESDVAPGRSDVLYATARNVELTGVAEIVLPNTPVAGTLSGTLTVRNPLEQPRWQVDGSILRFQYDKLAYGDLYLRSRYIEQGNRMFVTSNLVLRSDTLIGLKGYYDPDSKTSQLDFVLATNNLPVKLVEPFVKGTLYDLQGRLQIRALQLRGTLAAPYVSGRGTFEGVSFGVDYFKTRFSLDGAVELSQRQISMSGLKLRDVRGNEARVEGKLFHYGLRQLEFDLQILDMRNFLFMDTKAEDNELFYGRTIIRRGNADIKGKFGDLFINANVTTANGTTLNIPVSFYRRQTRLPYVRFKGAKGQDFSGIGQVDVLGMTLNLEIETTPDAEGQIVFDERTGEVIRAKGSGTLTMIVTRLGDFSLYGTYEVQQGSYLFNLRNTIKKRFAVEHGGTITWSGDPYDAVMNLSAIYRVNASLRSLDTTIRSSQSIPVDVYLRLRGALFRPEVNFDVQFPNTNSESSLALGSLQRSITNDPQALNNQVISLLAFGRFAPQGNFFGAGGAAGGVASSATEVLSNQLNTLLGQAFDDKLRVNVSTQSFNDINLGISTALFNNRFTIERNGVLVSNTNRSVTLGNVNLRYRLLPSEKRLQDNPNPLTLSLEVFNRENFGLGNQLVSTSRGGGVFLRKEFDTFGELLPLAQPKLDTTAVKLDSSILQLPIFKTVVPSTPPASAPSPSDTTRREGGMIRQPRPKHPTP
jgi:hypothetical protein